MKVDKKCRRCSKEFKVFLCRKKTAQFCSKGCATATRNEIIGNPKEVFICKICKIEYHTYRCKNTSLCSKKCAGVNLSNLYLSNGTLPPIRVQKGFSLWKTDIRAYKNIHNWVRNKLGTPMECSECGLKTENRSKIHWANISGLYLHDLEDWKRLCSKCHFNFDTKRDSMEVKAHIHN